MSKKGILLINLGTPESTSPIAIIRYLTAFLNDPRVIDIPGMLRWLLVNLFIIPFRFKKTAKAYQQIWTEKGSPLRVNSLALQNALANELGKNFQVELGMRYGNPSISQALNSLRSCNSIMVVPLFPQYSSAATGSALESVLKYIAAKWNIPELTLQKDFYSNPGFIAAYADIIEKTLNHKKVDLFIFSYHGLPERHLQKSDCQASCDKEGPCPNIEDKNQNCYRAQCFATSHLLAKVLGLEPSQYTVSFQSRLGRTPWIKPYTDVLLPKLIQEEIKNIAIVCPSFVADCLETLEEVNIRLRNDWQKLGGAEFTFIPSLNAHPIWVKALANFVKSEKESMK